MKKSAFLTTLLFGSMLSLSALADPLYADKLGPVSITGKAGEPHKILINGQVFTEDKNTWSLTVAEAYPEDQNPKWVLLGYGTSGNACEGTYRVLGLSGPSPKLSDEFGNCLTYSLLKTPTQAVFDFHRDTWAYSPRGLIKMPTLSEEENIRQGVDAYKAGDYDRAVRHLWPLREKKSAEAPFYLGLMALLSKGLPQDDGQAMKYFDQAAHMGYTPAMTKVGDLHAAGRGVAQDPTKAINWYKAAAGLGDGPGQYRLGMQLLAQNNAQEALKWLLLSQERLVDLKDLDDAKKNARTAEAMLTSEQVAAIKSDAATWKPQEVTLFGSAAALRAWVGRPPWERVHGHTIYEVEELMVRLKIAMGETVASRIPTMSLTSKGVEEDGWLVLSGCTPHNCNVSHYVLAVNLTTYGIMGCARYGDDLQQQAVTFSGADYPRIERTVAGRDKDACDQERLSVAGLRNILEAGMQEVRRNAPTPPQIAAAPPPAPAPAPKAPERSSGSGYAIDTNGTVVTNNHVVEGCRTLAIRRGQQVVPATLVAADAQNDLAAVKATLPGLLPVKFRDGKGIRAADGVVAMGYPYAGILATSPQVTIGSVTALAGIGDDSRYLQISAPIQPGNSGGPLFDLSGNVVGTNTLTMNALAIAEITGSIPQNVNFSIKSGVVREFLDSKGLSYQTAGSTAKLDPADVGEIGTKSVVMIECTR